MAIKVCIKCGAKNRVDERAEAKGRLPMCGRCGEQLKGALSVEASYIGKLGVVTDETFARAVVGASKKLPVLLDCWAPWCGPCRMIAPVLEQLAAESGGATSLAN